MSCAEGLKPPSLEPWHSSTRLPAARHCSKRLTRICTGTRYKYVPVRTHLCKCTHRHACTCAHTQALHVCAHTHMCVNAHTCIENKQACMCTSVCVCTPVCGLYMCMFIGVSIHISSVYVRVYRCTVYIYLYTYTRAHVYIRACTLTQSF